MSAREDLSRAIKLRECEAINGIEFFNSVCVYLQTFPEQKIEALHALYNHTNEGVREAFAPLWNLLRHGQLGDVDHVSQTSPLQPGARLMLFGGRDYYVNHGRPSWLNGRAYYNATFLCFRACGPSTDAVACVEFDDAIDLPRRKGRYALLVHSRSSVAWRGEGRVAIYLFDKLPEDFEVVQSSHPLETHAIYEVVPSLQPGVRLILFGGYTAAYSAPRWLNGREFYRATFRSFTPRGPGTVPVACVELDDEIDLPGHKGRYALLSPRDRAWTSAGDVSVYVFDAPPQGFEPLNSADPIESHAQYELVPPLATVAQPLNELDANADEKIADYAARRLQRLLWLAPELRPIIIPALIQKLRFAKAGPAAQRVLRDLGPPALSALIGTLSDKNSWLRADVADAIGLFGPEAKEALPKLNALLHDELHVRVHAAMAIWKIEGRTSEMARIVMEGLQHYVLDKEAAGCLRRMGPDAGQVVPALVEILRNGKVPSWRAQAAVALGGMGLEAAQAISALVEATWDSNKDVSGHAFGALRELRALARLGELILLELGDGTSQPLSPTEPA